MKENLMMTDPTSTDRARAATGLPPTSPTTDVALSQKEVAIRTRAGVVGQMEAAFQLAMPTGLEAKQLIRDATTALRNVPDLARTTQDSFLGALMTAAQLGLRPNVPTLGHGWILPFENRRAGTVEAQWILGYQGMIELAQRTGEISSIVAHTIYEKEEYEIELGLEEKLRHVPSFDEEARGPAILHYAIARFRHGGVVWHVIGEDEVERIKVRAKSSRSAYSPWNTDREAMARKSAVIRLFKFLPKTTLIANAIAADESVRTDLDPTALGKRDEEPPATTATVVRGPVSDSPDPALDSPPEAAQPASDAPKPAAVPPTRMHQSPTALRKGLISAAVEKHGDRVGNAIALVDPEGWGELVGEQGLTADYLSYVETAKLREIVALEWEDADRDAEAERQLAEDVPPAEGDR